MASQILNQPVRGYTFDCGSIKVPQDWQHPNDGKTFDLALIRVRNNNQSNRIGSLLVNPGGPGASGVELAVELTQELPNAITDRFDLIGFDPRGVGHSTEVQCISAKDQDKLYAETPDPVSAAQFNSIVTDTKQAETACGTKYGAQLSLFSTEQAARDMDAIRAAVGDSKLSYLGYSYGTLLGAVYAQLFPTKIRAMVLDGAIDPLQGAVARSEAQAGGFELAFGDFVTWCKANASQCPIWKDPRGAVTSAIAAAGKAPLTNADGRKVTDGWVYYGIISAMYSQHLWPILGQAIAQLGQHNPRLIMALADQYVERDAERKLLEPARREPRGELRRLRQRADRRPSAATAVAVAHEVSVVRRVGRGRAAQLRHRRMAGQGRSVPDRDGDGCPADPRHRYDERSGHALRRHREARQHARRGRGVDLAGRGSHRLSTDAVHHQRGGQLPAESPDAAEEHGLPEAVTATIPAPRRYAGLGRARLGCTRIGSPGIFGYSGG